VTTSSNQLSLKECEVISIITDSAVKDFVFKSKCAVDTQQKKYLAFLVGNKPTTLLYNGSAHGWQYKDFHSRCDLKAQTITLFKIKNGDCIGGYTSTYWSSFNAWVVDNESMLFNLSWCLKFPNKKAGWGIACYALEGPHFGDGEL
jgi:hypothetical protein